ncbi:uncharacterized protein MKK02DRAFT_40442 [Dioszegia hungarica]|uniref:Uncharacterized protein n=1 Tax=Dioszegia hungarica TaxID=4972 RepID=A0AA38LS37_9TREE|nr:uncharacterized protein MKK02DRAFT_40442 [Dioszegia hungarica]KAI9633058.1 hypothetical protein MKK02DRAFT_40442 [Dioszegia hungarica]
MSRPAAKSTEIDLRVSKPSRPAINTSSLDAKQAHIPNRAHSGASVHYETHSRGSSSNTKVGSPTSLPKMLDHAPGELSRHLKPNAAVKSGVPVRLREISSDSTLSNVSQGSTAYLVLGEDAELHFQQQSDVHDIVIPTEADVQPDPYKYLIDIEGQPDLRRFDPSVQVYLRLLGHTEALEALKPSVPAQKLADAELAGGWLALKRARWPRPGGKRRGVFFDPKDITPLAVQTCPSMPYIFNVDPDCISDQLEFPTNLEPAYTDLPKSAWIKSPYVRQSYRMCLSNAIVPLPSPCVPSDRPAWTEMVQVCYGDAHPVHILCNNRDINKDNNEKLVLASRDCELRLDCFAFPYRNKGLDKEADEALYVYHRDVLNFFEDSDESEEDYRFSENLDGYGRVIQ